MLDRKNKLLHKKEDNKKSMISVQMLRNKYRSPQKIKDFTCNCRQAFLNIPGPMYPCRSHAAEVMLVLTFALNCLSCKHSMLSNIYIIKTGVCVSQLNVPTLTSPPILKLLDSQGYLWLPYDLAEVIKLIGERFEPKKNFQKNTLPL